MTAVDSVETSWIRVSECCVQQAYHQRRLFFFFFCGHYAAVDCDHHCSRTLQCLLLSVAIVRCCIATSIVAPNQQRILEVFLSSGWLDVSLSAAHPSKSSPSPPKYFPFALLLQSLKNCCRSVVFCRGLACNVLLAVVWTNQILMQIFYGNNRSRIEKNRSSVNINVK